MTRLVNAHQMRAMDERTIELGLPSLVLMERAALGASDIVAEAFPEAHRVGIVCGRGNNGGDGLAMARILSSRGYDISVCLIADEETLSLDCAQNLALVNGLGLDFLIVSPDDEEEILEALGELGPCDLWVDALFGTGLDRPIKGPLQSVISFLSEQGTVLALDLPSGLHADSGLPLCSHVGATVTVTFGLPKTGLALDPGRSIAGEVFVIDIGIPEEIVSEIGWEAVWLRPSDLLVPKRQRAMHKGQAGRVLIIGGNIGFVGAAIMAGTAALARGAGLVTLAVHESLAPLIGVQHPELMSIPAFNDLRALDIEQAVRAADVVVIGPGLGRGQHALELLELTTQTAKTLVIDADALHLLSKHRPSLPPRSVLTPHPGEASALLGLPTNQVLLSPLSSARKIATEYGAGVVLKTSTSVVVVDDWVGINSTGNPGMAVGGMGDALAGIIAASLIEFDNPFEAISHAVCLHGAAGDRAVMKSGQRGLSVPELISALKELWLELEV